MKRYREINQYRKSFDIVTNYVHYPVAVFLCTLLSYTAITPNQVTALAVAVELIAAFLIFQDSSPNLLLVALLLQLGWILDLMDGLLARYKKVGFYNPEKPSIRGYYLDAVSDHTLKFIILGALTFYFTQISNEGWILGVTAMV
ncbi:MAG: CDP-alcohol phosphatidyltransferase family protein, partial [Candidatus Marinimicrobia bacterium]|nr:CDP-alcohol phosphatidyltransferase family protein [Candidatus Neomarinimicrobiota bacterium]